MAPLPRGDTVEHLGTQQTTELYGKPVTADVWFEKFNLPFTKVNINYTYYITEAPNGDVISHRITFGASHVKGGDGKILYGNFEVQRNLTEFRPTFLNLPAECLKPNVLKCHKHHEAEFEARFRRTVGLVHEVSPVLALK